MSSHRRLRPKPILALAVALVALSAAPALAAAPRDAQTRQGTGCTTQYGADTDCDGTPDQYDPCPQKAGPSSGGVIGCPGADHNGPDPSTTDSDGDGVVDTKDACPGTKVDRDTRHVNDDGCPDKDGDGVPDSTDKCDYGVDPDDPSSPKVDQDGCPPIQIFAGMAKAANLEDLPGAVVDVQCRFNRGEPCVFHIRGTLSRTTARRLHLDPVVYDETISVPYRPKDGVYQRQERELFTGKRILRAIDRADAGRIPFTFTLEGTVRHGNGPTLKLKPKTGTWLTATFRGNYPQWSLSPDGEEHADF